MGGRSCNRASTKCEGVLVFVGHRVVPTAHLNLQSREGKELTRGEQRSQGASRAFGWMKSWGRLLIIYLRIGAC
jgi:hypothetical protein